MAESISNKIATFIKQKRLALGMSQREFAIHVFDNPKKQDWISRIENGRGITVDTVDKILKKLNSDIEIIEY